jgi:hypothetical protein
MYLRWLLVLLALSTPAFAQQQPAKDCPTLVLTQTQRNQFLDAFNDAAVKVDALTADLAKAQAKIKELESKEPAK